MYRSFCTSVGSQVGSHSLWTAADGYGRLWTANRLVPDGMDRSGLLWTACVHLRIRRLGIRVPPGVLLTRGSEHWFSPNAATKTRRWFSAVNSRPGMPKRSTVSRFHAPRTHHAPTTPPRTPFLGNQPPHSAPRRQYGRCVFSPQLAHMCCDFRWSSQRFGELV